MTDEPIKTYEKTLTYGDQLITTTFDECGQVIDVVAQQGNGDTNEPESVASVIDHTLLKPDATRQQIAILCQEALDYNFGAVCVNAGWVSLCHQLLIDSGVKIAAVVGFPLGATTTSTKVYETKRAIDHGAVEIDMVMNVGELKSGDLTEVADDMRRVVKAAHRREAIVKAIIETHLLTEEEKITACLLAKEVGADFVKTSTGFTGGGATIEDIALMRAVVGPGMGVKASGGVRTFADAQRMLAAGASRIGASSGVKILEEEKADRV